MYRNNFIVSHSSINIVTFIHELSPNKYNNAITVQMLYLKHLINKKNVLNTYSLNIYVFSKNFNIDTFIFKI